MQALYKKLHWTNIGDKVPKIWTKTSLIAHVHQKNKPFGNKKTCAKMKIKHRYTYLCVSDHSTHFPKEKAQFL